MHQIKKRSSDPAAPRLRRLMAEICTAGRTAGWTREIWRCNRAGRSEGNERTGCRERRAKTETSSPSTSAHSTRSESESSGNCRKSSVEKSKPERFDTEMDLLTSKFNNDRRSADRTASCSWRARRAGRGGSAGIETGGSSST